MLVTLGTNQAISASSSFTYTYSPQSVQKVMLFLEDAGGGHIYGAKVTIQIGSTTVCNGASFWGLAGLNALQNGEDLSNLRGLLSIDLGSHICSIQDNLYVTVSTSDALDAVDCSAIVNEPGQNFPVRITEYSDNTFTSPNNLLAVAYDASGNATIEESTDVCEVRNQLESSSPQFASSASYFKSVSPSSDSQYWGLLNRNSVPMSTTYNYTSSLVDRIITVEQMGTTAKAQAQARQSARVAVSMAGK